MEVKSVENYRLGIIVIKSGHPCNHRYHTTPRCLYILYE